MPDCDKCQDCGLRLAVSVTDLMESDLYEGPDGELYVKCECNAPRFEAAIRGVFKPVTRPNNG